MIYSKCVKSLFLNIIVLHLIAISIIGCSSDEIDILEPSQPASPFPIAPLEFSSLDINTDGVNDFLFEYMWRCTCDNPSSSCTVSLSVFPVSDNMVQYSYPNGNLPLPDGTLIGASLGWSEYRGDLAFIGNDSSGWDDAWSGVWAGVSEMSLGLIIVIDDKTHYGWVKLSVRSEHGRLTVHDFAYQPYPNEPILAGIHP
jgi:hypothetical protein